MELKAESNKGALIITYTILVVPYYNCSIMGPQTLFYLWIARPLYVGTHKKQETGTMLLGICRICSFDTNLRGGLEAIFPTIEAASTRT